MSGRREKKTLAMFAAMLLFGFLCICAYVFLGHNWNYAVIQGDDTFGDMESYTVFLYEGTIVSENTELNDDPQIFPPLPIDEPGLATPEELAAAQAKKEAEEKAAAEKAASIAEAKEGETKLGQNDSGEESRPTLSQRIARRINAFFNLNTETTASDEEAKDVLDDPVVSEEMLDGAESGEEVSASSFDTLVEAYEAKGANTFALHVKDFDRYKDGLVLERNGQRVGVLGVNSMVSCASIQKKVDLLRSLNVSLIIAIVDEVPRIAGVSDIDIVIRANEVEPARWPYEANGRYITLAPVEGSVAATIISPSKIVVSKVL